ncbi:phytoene desaturase family protein [Jonesia quinghaiensis]|uniref:phytoene desaturase family protein n=1 Tax=Jonesia quinghaiensis TaxID=262806 RepID=UPI000418BBAE|nr:NAD(P)/FAD-dependent oxidoreductase [Jonesia quinghaiensis]
MTAEFDAVIVGSGPNGLAAAIILARAGLRVAVLEEQPTLGGGARTADLNLGFGTKHDICSAVHPMAVASPFFAEFDLAARGVDLLEPDVQYAQPLDHGPAAVAYRSIQRTAHELGDDGQAWLNLLGPLARRPDGVIAAALSDKRSITPAMLKNIVGAGAFGISVLEQGTRLWGARFTGDAAPALLTGVAAHAISPLPSLAGAGTALMLGSLAHSHGWPIPRGGSQSIIDAMVADLIAHGGVVVPNTPVRTQHDLPPARAYLFDTTPRAALTILGQRIPEKLQRALQKFRYGNAAAKVDFVISDPVPWRDPRMRGAGTIHVGGTRADMVAAERLVAKGVFSQEPATLVSDPTVVDETRIVSGKRPLWAYAHVPAGSQEDPTEVVTRQIERFAPGFRDTIVASQAVPAHRMSEHNANYIDGDIASGAATLWQMFARPTLAADPYSLGVPGAYLCSASTPPGPGVHGLSGMYAAERVLKNVFGVKRRPSLAPDHRGTITGA